MLSAVPANADTFPVINGNDSGAGSLRAAITSANGNANGSVVDQIPITHTGTIDLLTALPNISTPMTITGPGAGSLAVRRDASVPAMTQFRFVGVTLSSGTARIEGITMSGARATGFAGGALIMSGLGTLELESLVFTDNRSGQGGAIRYDRGFTSIRNSTFNLNQAGFGGAIQGSSFGTDVGLGEVVNSTITGNTATEFGGGIHLGSLGHIRIQSSTITGNTADSDNSGAGDGGGTYHGSDDPAVTDEFQVANTLYAGNLVGGNQANPNTQCGGNAYTSSGYNLRTVADPGCTGFTATGDIVNANPMIGSLGPNGGPTPTIPLLAGSPAIDAGNPAAPGGAFPACPATDQRLLLRGGVASRCDIGAFELNASAPVPPSPAPGPAAGAPPLAQCAGKQATIAVGRATISGTAGNDTIVGTSAADVIDGAGGNDNIRGLGGNDAICGDEGKDTLIGGAGNDKLLGGAGKDTLKGGKGKDKLKGGAGKDTQIQ